MRFPPRSSSKLSDSLRIVRARGSRDVRLNVGVQTCVYDAGMKMFYATSSVCEYERGFVLAHSFFSFFFVKS